MSGGDVWVDEGSSQKGRKRECWESHGTSELATLVLAAIAAEISSNGCLMAARHHGPQADWRHPHTSRVADGGHAAAAANSPHFTTPPHPQPAL